MLRKENKPSWSSKTSHKTNTNNGISEKFHKKVDETFFLAIQKFTKRRRGLLVIPKLPKKGKDLNNL